MHIVENKANRSLMVLESGTVIELIETHSGEVIVDQSSKMQRLFAWEKMKKSNARDSKGNLIANKIKGAESFLARQEKLSELDNVNKKTH